MGEPVTSDDVERRSDGATSGRATEEKTPLQRLQATVLAHAEPVVKVIGILTLLWSGLAFVSTPNQYDLLVWTDENTRVYPAPATKNRSLPLSYDGTPASAVRMMTIGIQNSGRQSIGDVGSRWRLTLTVPEASRLVLIAVLKKDPANIQFVSVPGARPNSLQFDVGVLQPRTKIRIAAAAIYSGKDRLGRLDIHTSLPGLPVAESPRPASRLGAKFLLPLWIAFFLLGLREMLKKAKTVPPEAEADRIDKAEAELAKEDARKPAGWRFVLGLLKNALLTFFAAVVVSLGLGWVLAFFL